MMGNVDKKIYENVNKVVLAYSGGLDTSVLLKLLQEELGAEVVSVCVDLGQEEDKKAIAEKAEDLGAKHYTVDALEEFVHGYVWKAIQANCLYQGAYPNSTALGRPLIAKHLVGIAEKEGADAIAHGCTGKGNDQVRLDVSIAALNPSLEIIAPVRDWNLSRPEEVKYAVKRGIPVPEKIKKYSIDENIWGRSIECGHLEFPEKEAGESVLGWVTPPEKAPDKPVKVKVWFENGVPVKLEPGNVTDPVAIVKTLNKLGGDHGIGIIDHMEDRTVGLKSREVYECPAATILLKAHKDLEKHVFTKAENEFKPLVDKLWGEMVYKGLWFSPLMSELDAFIQESQQKVSGWVQLKLYKGSTIVTARWSPNAIYDLNLISYGKDSSFDQTLSKGFIKLWGLDTVMANQLKEASK